MNFEELELQTIPLKDFSLQWRFTDSKYDLLPDPILQEINPLNELVSNEISSYLSEKAIHPNGESINQTLFPYQTELDIDWGNFKSIGMWLSHLNISGKEKIFLTWDNETSLTTRWEIFTQFWDSFYYPSSDDLTVFNADFKWVLFIAHYDKIIFGSTE